MAPERRRFMTRRPTLTEQLTAVEWASRHVDARKGRVETHGMRESEREAFEVVLRAAAETLRALLNERGTLR
jgi:hypothetical protein